MQNLIFTQQMQLATHHIYGNTRLGIKHTDTTLYMRNITINGFDTLGNVLVNDVLDSLQLQIDTVHYQHALATKQYELTNHLGNVLATILDRKTQNQADVVSAQHYYPFGSTMQTWEADGKEYAYGFNGKEKDNDTYGEGNAYDFGARIYDGRLGRWMSVDPLATKYPSLSTYNYCANNPSLFIDPDGKKISRATRQERKDWRELRSQLSKTDAGRVTIKLLKRSDEIIHINLTNDVLVNSVPGVIGSGNQIVEGNYNYADPTLNQNSLNGAVHSRLIVSKGTWQLKENVRLNAGVDLNQIDRTNPDQVNMANDVLNDEIAVGRYNFVNLGLQPYPQGLVSLMNYNLRTPAGNGWIGEGSQWINAPAWNWNGRKEQLSKPLTAETLCEFIARVAVHEGTHEESGKDYRALAPSEQQKWDADPTRFEQKPYDREIEQIDQQRKNRNGN